MFFFRKNLKAKHKALCLVILGILVDCWLCSKISLETFPYIEYLENGVPSFSFPKIILAFEISIKMLLLYIFRKF